MSKKNENIATDVSNETDVTLGKVYDVTKEIASDLTKLDTENHQIHKKVILIGRTAIEHQQTYQKLEALSNEYNATIHHLAEDVSKEHTDFAERMTTIDKHVLELIKTSKEEAKVTSPIKNVIKSYMKQTTETQSSFVEVLEHQTQSFTKESSAIKTAIDDVLKIVGTSAIHEDIETMKNSAEKIQEHITQQFTVIDKNHVETHTKLDVLLATMTGILGQVERHQTSLEDANQAIEQINKKVDGLNTTVDNARFQMDVQVPETLEEMFAARDDHKEQSKASKDVHEEQLKEAKVLEQSEQAKHSNKPNKQKKSNKQHNSNGQKKQVKDTHVTDTPKVNNDGITKQSVPIKEPQQIITPAEQKSKAPETSKPTKKKKGLWGMF